jgi:hypothetical protein
MPTWASFGTTWLNLDMVVAWWTFTHRDGSLAITVEFGAFPELVARMRSLSNLPPQRVTWAFAGKPQSTHQFFGADAQALFPQLLIACAAARRKESPSSATGIT